MRFLFYAPQMAEYGGIERHVCGLACKAAREGHTVMLLTTSNSLGAELRAELQEAGVVLRELGERRGHAGKLRKLLWLFSTVLRLRMETWDLIYTNGQSALAQVVWLAGRAGTRCVHHHHTAADAAEQLTWSPHYFRALRRAPELVGCSQSTCDEINRAVGRTDAIFLPYLTRCPVESSQVHERPPAPVLRFGFIGRLLPEKGINVICRLSAHPSLADVTWQIHGQGPAYPEAFFKQWPNVQYRGAYQDLQAQAAILLELDALVLFSTHNEGMPLSLIEGLSAGLPWLATDRGGTREIAQSPLDCLLVPLPASDETLRLAVRSLADRILSGHTSRLRQRAAYDQSFAPYVVAAKWLDYFTKPSSKNSNTDNQQRQSPPL